MRALILWGVVCVVGLMCILPAVNADIVYDDEQIEFKIDTSRHLFVSAEVISLEAASPDFFVFRKVTNDDIIAGKQTEKPTGWQYDQYYYFEENEVIGGEWVVEDGANITVIIDNPERSNVTLRLVPSSIFANIMGGIILTIVFWAISSFFGALIYIAIEEIKSG